MNTILRRLRSERGIALVIALMMMTVLTIVGTAAVVYTTQNSHHSHYSKAQLTASRLAEAGLNNAFATLGRATGTGQTSPALQQSSLPATEPSDTDPSYAESYEGGTAKWWGVLDATAAPPRWTLYGKGVVRNPNSNSAPVTRTRSATMTVSYRYDQDLNASAWNYIYVTNKGGANVCDVDINQNVEVDAPFFIEGNLCLQNNAKIVEDLANPRIPVSLVVKGKVQFANGASIGRASTNTITEAHLAGGCGSSLSNVHTCDPNSPTNDRVWAGTLDTAPTAVGGVTPDWTTWYSNASPGPLHACNPGAVRPPTFDDDTTQNLTSPFANGSVTATFNLTPTQDYSCVTSSGSISWTAATKTLSVSGVIYIDGSVSITNQAVNEYNGQATLYLSGTFYLDGKLCGKRLADLTDCDFTTWNPNTEMLILVAHGSDGNGNSAYLDNNAKWEGGVYAQNAIDLQNNAVVEGPMIAGTVKFLNNSIAKPFPVIDTVPLGTPGNLNTHATPTPPGNYSG